MIVRFPCSLKMHEVAYISDTLQKLATWPIAALALSILGKQPKNYAGGCNLLQSLLSCEMLDCMHSVSAHAH